MIDVCYPFVFSWLAVHRNEFLEGRIFIITQNPFTSKIKKEM